MVHRGLVTSPKTVLPYQVPLVGAATPGPTPEGEGGGVKGVCMGLLSSLQVGNVETGFLQGQSKMVAHPHSLMSCMLTRGSGERKALTKVHGHGRGLAGRANAWGFWLEALRELLHGEEA